MAILGISVQFGYNPKWLQFRLNGACNQSKIRSLYINPIELLNG